MEIVVRVPVLSDNYAWLIHHAGQTVALDPGEAAPVAAAPPRGDGRSTRSG